MATTVPVSTTYFSDVLCIWAYASQIRLEEISRDFGADVQIDYRFCSVFGNTEDKIAQGWADKGAYGGFNRHLQEVGKKFGHIDVHPEIWLSAKPASSDSAHLFIKAVQIAELKSEGGGSAGSPLSTQLIWQLRRAFFHECRDVSQRKVQHAIAEEIGIDLSPVEAEINSGAAFASLAADYQQRDRLKIEGSPTYVLNQGCQKLYGNLGYRVIEANIRELLRGPGADERSWC
ncbi:DsbA family protein [Hoeflea sp. G2-23]|uniref:DsbA family protein n=1 Tax=Hoeflea algicola TaxID=2983763 RepID=A0ABT3Z7R4_9HYPH|nr:DsbA family protein [Hoeflea algicola]MCY0147815.1 DsbA family protein [Hoeflea algicola]